MLIVDDDPALRHLLCVIAALDGYESVEASDGALAQAELGRRQFDVVVLDLMLPKKSGHEILEMLAASQPPRPNVIVVTAASENHIRAIDRSVVFSVVRKPFDLDQLRNEIRKALGKRPLGLTEPRVT